MFSSFSLRHAKRLRGNSSLLNHLGLYLCVRYVSSKKFHILSLKLSLPLREAFHFYLPVTASFPAIYRVSLQGLILKGQNLQKPQTFSTEVSATIANKANPFIQQLLTEHCLCAWHSSRHHGYRSEQNRPCLYPHGAYIQSKRAVPSPSEFRTINTNYPGKRKKKSPVSTTQTNFFNYYI